MDFESFTSVTVPAMKPLNNLLFFEVPFLRLHDSMCALKYGVHVPFGAALSYLCPLLLMSLFSYLISFALGATVKDMTVALGALAKVDPTTIQFISVNHQRSFKVLEDDLVQIDFPKRQLLIAYVVPS